jgi:hypothetical protein
MAPTGLFFHEQTPQAIADAVQQFERRASEFSADACRANAESFSTENFKIQMAALVRQSVADFGY